jgi:hypothetical protein
MTRPLGPQKSWGISLRKWNIGRKVHIVEAKETYNYYIDFKNAWVGQVLVPLLRLPSLKFSLMVGLLLVG